MIKAFLTAALLLPATAGSAYAYCYEPSAPYCATQYGEFSDESDFDSCRRKMGYYADEVDTYTSCRTDEANEAVQDAKQDSEDALSTFNDAVRSFNRRADG